MRGILFYAHSGTRYLVLMTAVLSLLSLLVCLLRSRRPGGLERGLLMTFNGALDLQVLLGLALLLQVPFYAALSGHLVMMISAAVLLHAVSAIDRRRPADRPGRAASLAVTVLVTLLLIVGGIMAIGRPLLGSTAA